MAVATIDRANTRESLYTGDRRVTFFGRLLRQPKNRRDNAAAIWISLSKVAKVLERPVEAEYEWFGVVMAHDFDNKTVFMVAAIIGGVVLLLGLVGALA